LAKALSQHNVRLLENHIIAFDDFYLAGLGDFHGQEDDVTILDNCDPQKPKIVIAHNPDTALKYGDRIVDLTLSGHTHAGQVRIPGLLGMAYRHILKLVGPFDDGLHHHIF
jgi:predicted MPP superfamily phosphohydrolase